MATIFLGVSGEGRGHAARAQVLVDLLKEEHRLVIYAYGAALDLLKSEQRHRDVEVRPIPGMRFAYNQRGQLAPLRTLAGALPFLTQMSGRAVELARTLEREHADLVISDFEPLLGRAGNLAGLPVVAIDHQQFLRHYDLSQLPGPLQKKAAHLTPFVSAYYKKLTASVISAFFFPQLKITSRQHPIVQAGVLLRSELIGADPQVGDHLVAYLRRDAPPDVLRALSASQLPIRVYGTQRTGQFGQLSFHAIERRRFVDDLCTSRALISSAGNQVIGEALFLRKPVLCYPEPGNIEQAINGHFLQASAQGCSAPVECWNAKFIRDFVEKLPTFVDAIRPERLNGNRIALGTIRQHLSHPIPIATTNAWRASTARAAELGSSGS